MPADARPLPDPEGGLAAGWLPRENGPPWQPPGTTHTDQNPGAVTPGSQSEKEFTVTDHIIQHTCAEQKVMICSTTDGQEIVLQVGEDRKTTSHTSASLWCATFMLLATMPPLQAGKMLDELPAEMEDMRPVLVAAVASPGLTALYALLLRYALEDAKLLRGPASPVGGLGGYDGLGGLGGLLP